MNEINNVNTETGKDLEKTSFEGDVISDDEEIDDTGIGKEQEQPEDSADKKKAEHEAAEAKRKVEWEAQQAGKKAAVEKALQELLAMSDDDVANKSVKRTGDDLERLTRRNMKMCVTEYIQTLCLDKPVFARLVCHPRKSMINCFKYINEKAKEYVKQELEMQGQKAAGEIVEDVPDDLCYQWAEDYYNDPDAEIDKDKDDKFVPKPYYGGSSSSKSKKKEPAKKTEPPKSALADSAPVEQLSLLGA
ncbi:MAG: PcfK-like family protein [Oscillospiraceae bacterium]|nr:PcfK-like family protein [Oscillospiraceae bacterium]